MGASEQPPEPLGVPGRLPEGLKIAFSLTSRIAEGRKIKVEKLDAQVSLAPRPISYSGFAARVFANRKSDSGRFGDPEKEVA